MDEITRKQMRNLKISPGRPLVVLDADEVLVHFARPFEDYLLRRGHRLVLTEYSLDFAVRDPDGVALPIRDVIGMIDDFADRNTRNQPATPGAVAGVRTLSEIADVVVLTNVPHHLHGDRVENLRGLGIDVPVLSNSGPKGPALRALQDRAAAPLVFVDDSPDQIASAAGDVPQVTRIHFTGCDLVRAVLPVSEHAHHSPETWDEVARLGALALG